MKHKFQITKEFRFEAAHRLLNHDGKCRRLHGHSFRMRLVLEGDRLEEIGPKAGMLQDFGDVSRVVKPWVDQILDHQYLNDTLEMANPTSENIAQYVFKKFQPQLPLLVAVEVDETCTSSCRYEILG